MSLRITDNNEIIFYNSSNKFGPKKCLNENDVISLLPSQENYNLTILTISYDEIDEKDEILNILLNKHNSIVDENIKKIISHYKERSLSYQDTIYKLYDYLKTIKIKNKTLAVYDTLEEFKRDLKNLKKQDVSDVISDSLLVNDNEDGLTPLHMAVIRGTGTAGTKKVVRKLLGLGANYNIKTCYGMTPRDCASLRNYEIHCVFNQHEAVNSLINDKIKKITNLKNSQTYSLAEELSILFDSYAHPPFLSLHWRDHRKLAAEIAENLKTYPRTPQECIDYINFVTEDIEMSKTGTFKGLIKYAKNKIKVIQEKPVEENIKYAQE